MVVPEQAAIVNHIFKRFLECSGIRELALALKREGVAASIRPNRRRNSGELELAASRGALYSILRNPIYVGLISHKGDLFHGQHEGIVDRVIWDEVQAKLSESRRCQGRPNRKTESSPLMGKLFDESGRTLTPVHTNKKGRRYRYYVSHSDDRDDDRLNQSRNGAWKLPAPDIEGRVKEIVASMVRRETDVASTAADASMKGAEINALLETVRTAEFTKQLEWIERVELHPEHLTVSIRLPTKTIVRMRQRVPIAMKRRGVERRMIISPDVQQSVKPDPLIIKALGIGHRYWEQLSSEQPLTAVEYAKREGVDNRYVGRALQLVFLAPEIVEQFAMGRQPADWTSKRLLTSDAPPINGRVLIFV